VILTEFTGERVIPGLVEQSLWNEHVSRYSFAAGLADKKRVLDVGCGAGYGTAAMAEKAEFALGFDISPEAIEHARQNYGEKAKFAVASAQSFPAESGSFDLITAFEVIEHLDDWKPLLSEASRVLADGGLFLVSTPNKTYYGEARRQEGPNPFHVHEFEYSEFLEALTAWFPEVRILAQNRVEAFSFSNGQSPATGAATFAEAGHDVGSAHFYVAVCGRQPVPSMAYVYIPTAGNLLWERERHIRLLEQQLEVLSAERNAATVQLAQFESDLADRNKWIAGLEAQLRDATVQLAQFESELADRNKWIAGLEAQLRDATVQLAQFESELATRTTWVSKLEQQLLDHQQQRDAALAAVDTSLREVQERTDWARNLDEELTTARSQVYELVAKLGTAEEVVIERTKWAQTMEHELGEERARLKEIEATLGEKESIVAELTAEVTRGRNELGILLATLRAQSAAIQDRGYGADPGASASLVQEHFAELRELVVELEKLRTSQARLFEIQTKSRSELERRLESLTHERRLVAGSRWLRLGRALGLGPGIRD
jgi:SAM-dependent methyltransferase